MLLLLLLLLLTSKSAADAASCCQAAPFMCILGAVLGLKPVAKIAISYMPEIVMPESDLFRV
jgi:hypothetical protein